MEQSYDQHIRQQVTTLFQAMEQRVTPEEMERIKLLMLWLMKRINLKSARQANLILSIR